MSRKIRLSGVVNDSIVDGPGLRLSIFTQGCLMECEGCQNKETWDINGGSLYNIDDLVIEWRKNPLIKGITISGGEPFLQAESCLELAKRAALDGLDVIIYTGYIYEDLISRKDPIIDELLSYTKYLIDGPFILKKKSLMLLFRGSTNQRIIDIDKTKKQNKVVLMDESNY
ncbi:anaerobic ribonucleoside-triphosphate reductase activating protein [Acholeplasma sp. OttesenSCG-928-E16]|nr:anaerobic ribonucleoside-triphosphate reductase activating protein [Acholeplasma sp. OttesenSCG-928-E16]